MVRVRAATPGDADAVADLWVALAREQRAYGSHLLAEPNRAAIRASMAHHAVEGGLTVACDDDGIVGFVRYDVTGGSLAEAVSRGVIRDVYVVPDRRGAGVGSALLDAAEATLRDRGVDVIGLEAMVENDDAVRFYEDRGYRRRRVEFEREVETDKHSREER